MFVAGIEHPVRAACVVAGAVLVVYALWDWLLDAVGLQTKKRLEANIREWLDAFNVGTRKIDEPESMFALVASMENDTKMLIRRPKGLNRYLVLQSAILVAPEHKAILDRLSPKDQGIFSLRLSVELSRAGMGYTMDLANNTVALVKRIPITQNLNEDSFMTAVDAVDNAKMRVLRSLSLMILDAQERIGEAQPPAAAANPT